MLCRMHSASFAYPVGNTEAPDNSRVYFDKWIIFTSFEYENEIKMNILLVYLFYFWFFIDFFDINKDFPFQIP